MLQSPKQIKYHAIQNRKFKKNRFLLCGVITLLSVLSINNKTIGQTQTAVQKYGALRVSGNKMVDQAGASVTLRGMSIYWSQWQAKYYNYNTIKWLRDDWKVTVVRAAMAVDVGGYATNPTVERDKIYTVIDACISLGIYVIVDFHAHEANNYQTQARTFFGDVSRKYGNTPNILYEPWNEPRDVSWASIIKPYHENIVDVIRANASNAVVICGTRFYSQEVDEAAANPVNRTNIAYTLHFYANTHKQFLRDKAQAALNRGKALFVTEYGTTDASGDGFVNEAESNTWFTFLDNNGTGYCNWSVAEVPESSAILNTGAGLDNWTTSQLKQSGNFVRNMLRAKAPNLTTNGTGAVSNGTYQITFRHSGKSLNVEGNATADGGNVVQYPYGGGNNEKWFVQNVGGTTYSIKNVNSTRGLDVAGASTAAGADVNQWFYSGNNNQKWYIESVGSGYYRVRNVNSSKCIEMAGSSTANTSIQQWDCTGGTNQSFTFTKLNSATSAASAGSEGAVSVVAVDDLRTGAGVFPNPSNGAFYINGNKKYTYTLLNAQGAVLEKGLINNRGAVGANLTAGLYLLLLQSEKGQEKFKLIKR